jgi:hypothetical protein
LVLVERLRLLLTGGTITSAAIGVVTVGSTTPHLLAQVSDQRPVVLVGRQLDLRVVVLVVLQRVASVLGITVDVVAMLSPFKSRVLAVRVDQLARATKVEMALAMVVPATRVLEAL